MSCEVYLLTVIGMGLATFIPRWLKFVPAGILSALVMPSVLMNPATHEISLWRPEFLVALPTLAFGWWSRSLGGTVIVGMLLFFLAGKLL